VSARSWSEESRSAPCRARGSARPPSRVGLARGADRLDHGARGAISVDSVGGQLAGADDVYGVCVYIYIY
jgi:hypothetical protein